MHDNEGNEDNEQNTIDARSDPPDEPGRAPLAAEITRSNGVVVVSLGGDLDAVTARGLARAVVLASRLGARVLVVDTTDLGFVDSGGRRALHRACVRVNAILVRGDAVFRFDELAAAAQIGRGDGLLRGDGVGGLGDRIDERVA